MGRVAMAGLHHPVFAVRVPRAGGVRVWRSPGAALSLMLSRRADFVLRLMRGEPDYSYYRDGADAGNDYFRLYTIPNIGLRTINELLTRRLIEPHPEFNQYRLVECEEGLDLGDLWVA
jgi:hypothetical protein